MCEKIGKIIEKSLKNHHKIIQKCILMEKFKFFKNPLHLFCVNIYKQDFPYTLIHLVKAFQSSAPSPEMLYKY